MRNLFIVSHLLALGLAACDPEIALGGFVKENDGTPIQGAEVRVLCDGKPSRYDRAVSDPRGWFQIYGVGCLPNRCVIEVASAGRAPKRIDIMKHCRDVAYQCNTGCNHSEFKIVIDD